MQILGVIPFNIFIKLQKGNLGEKSHVMFSPNKQHSFEPFVCLDLVLER